MPVVYLGVSKVSNRSWVVLGAAGQSIRHSSLFSGAVGDTEVKSGEEFIPSGLALV